MARKRHAHTEVGAVLHQQLRHRQAVILELCDCVENGCLSADPDVIHRGTGVDACAAIEQQTCGVNGPELRSHVQQGRSLEQEAAAACAAAVQFRKPAVYELRIGIELL